MNRRDFFKSAAKVGAVVAIAPGVDKVDAEVDEILADTSPIDITYDFDADNTNVNKFIIEGCFE
jgi:hypothetical protein